MKRTNFIFGMVFLLFSSISFIFAANVPIQPTTMVKPTPTIVPISLSLNTVHLWDTYEITLKGSQSYSNPYADVEVWVQLKGPGFEKKVWGFWDGENIFKVRVVATTPGNWTWTSASNQINDKGLNQQSGNFTAIEWTETERQTNPNRRGFVRASKSGHAFSYADGTPFFMMGETWWPASTFRCPFKGTEPAPDYIPNEKNWSFEGGIQTLKKNQFNTIAMIAAYPNWNDDGQKVDLYDDAGVYIRSGKLKSGTTTCRDMHDEFGNQPFMFPGKCKGKNEFCADFDRINPAYFKSLDKKLTYLQSQGFLAYMEAVRRDHGPVWMEYHDFVKSYSRYLNYLQARYGTYNIIFSLCHIDILGDPNLLPTEWKAAFDYWYKKYGGMPFGQVVTVMGADSTFSLFGHIDKNPWLQAHTVGNAPKDHHHETSLIECTSQTPAIPCFNSEPHYIGWANGINAVNREIPQDNSERDNYFARAHAYGSFLSGALAGHIFGSGARWVNTTGEQPSFEFPAPWLTLTYSIYGQVKYLRQFILSEGPLYQDLVVANQDLTPDQSPGFSESTLEGWAHMMRTPDKRLVLLYFENKCVPNIIISGLNPNTNYKAQWYNPINGDWLPMNGAAGANGIVTSDTAGKLTIPSYPSRTNSTITDWAAKLYQVAFN